MVVNMFGFGRRGIAYLGWIALEQMSLACPRLQRGDQELFAEPQKKFLGFFDVFAAAGRMAKGTLEMIII